MTPESLRPFRIVSLLEGISYVALLGIAMPLRYAAGKPMAVKVVGMIHGLLFGLFVIVLAVIARRLHCAPSRSRWP